MRAWRTSRAARPPRPWPAVAAAATSAERVALLAARSPPLARAGTNAAGSRVSARVQRERGGPGCLKPRRGRGGGGSRCSTREAEPEAPPPLSPPTRGPAVALGGRSQAPPPPWGPWRPYARAARARIASSQSARGLGQREQRDKGAGAATRRLTAVAGKISAPLPPLPSPSSHPTSFPRPTLQ